MPVGVSVLGDGMTKDVVVSRAHPEIGDDEGSVRHVGTDKAVSEPLKSAGCRNISGSGS
jgi:hypothetical protein